MGIAHLRRVGEPNVTGIFVSETISIRAKARVECVAVVTNAEGEVVKEIRLPGSDAPPTYWVDLSLREERVAKALRLLAQRTWDSIYKAWGLVEEDITGPITNHRWATCEEQSRFDQTANNALILGDDARHAHHKWKPPDDPMTLDEAYQSV